MSGVPSAVTAMKVKYDSGGQSYVKLSDTVGIAGNGNVYAIGGSKRLGLGNISVSGMTAASPLTKSTTSQRGSATAKSCLRKKRLLKAATDDVH